MKKEETIALVGKENIGGWWNLGRVIAIVTAVAIAVFTVHFLFGFDLKPDVGIGKLVIGLFFFGLLEALIISSVFSSSRLIRDTSLKVEKINKTGTETEVLGKDGKRHTLKLCRGINLNKDQKTSFARISGRLSNLWIDVTVGQDMNQIWK